MLTSSASPRSSCCACSPRGRSIWRWCPQGSGERGGAGGPPRAPGLGRPRRPPRARAGPAAAGRVPAGLRVPPADDRAAGGPRPGEPDRLHQRQRRRHPCGAGERPCRQRAAARHGRARACACSTSAMASRRCRRSGSCCSGRRGEPSPLVDRLEAAILDHFACGRRPGPCGMNGSGLEREVTGLARRAGSPCRQRGGRAGGLVRPAGRGRRAALAGGHGCGAAASADRRAGLPLAARRGDA